MATNAETMRINIGIPIKFMLLILWVAWISSCTGSKKITNETTDQVQTAYTPQIIFQNYTLERDSLDNYTIKLINTIVSEGKIKPGLHHYSSSKSGDLKCLILDANKKPISDITIPDPLTKRIEYQQEDRSLTSRLLLLDQAEFSVRLQLDSASSFIAIERIDPSGTSRLFTTEIDRL